MAQQTGGSYEKVPLRSDNIRVCVAQSWVNTDTKDPKKGRRDNVDHMLKLVDVVQTMSLGGRTDFVVFHEFPIGGYDTRWEREQMLNDIAIEVPGEETQAIGQKAKEWNCYIHFGSYGKLADWPGHFMNLGIIVGPSGDIIYQRWKMRNIGGWGFSTTVNDVLDEYVKRYGWDAVFPVARTDIGNLAVIPETGEPELARAYGIRGTEIMIRYMTGAKAGFARLDLQAACRAGQYYGLYVNNALHYMDGVEIDLGAGGSAIINPMGDIMTETSSPNEATVNGFLPMATYRKTHAIPYVPLDLLKDVYDKYQPRFPANTFLTTDKLPNNLGESFSHYGKIARW